MDAQDESDWEYEYDESATETFYVTLDLTTHNGPLRAARKRATPTSKQETATGRPEAGAEAAAGAEEGDGDQAGQNAAGTAAEPSTAAQSQTGNEDWNSDQEFAAARKRAQGQSVAEGEGDGDGEAESERVQIMQLYSQNPIVSYRNHIFSCEWADGIGTDMAFAKPEGDASDIQRLRQTAKYDLVSVTPLKLLGHKASLVSTTHSRATAAKSEGPAGAKRPLSAQALFFERLREIKRAKGENETVRTSIPQRRLPMLYGIGSAERGEGSSQGGAAAATAARQPSAAAIAASNVRHERLRAWERTGKQLAEVEALKQRAAQGDEGAMTALEEIMARTVERAAAEAQAAARKPTD
ncbi:hypothetical protein KEM52_004752 [Ascosphaera acerosa]|nr:hypothetical protein KEM52_004752 [Ascosphaera acerosa]